MNTKQRARKHPKKRKVRKTPAAYRKQPLRELVPMMEALARDRLLDFWAFMPDPRDRRGKTTHIKLIYEGTVVLEWWPSTGTWWCPRDGAKGKSSDYVEVVATACLKASRVPVPQ